MAVSRVAVTTFAPSSVGSFTLPALPTHATGDRLVCVHVGKTELTSVPSINQGWTLIGSGTGGTGTNAADAGQMFWFAFAKDATSNAETPPTITMGATNPNSSVVVTASHRPGAGLVWQDTIAASAAWVKGASDTNTASPLAGTTASFTGVFATAGDAIFAVGGVPTDLGTAQGASTITATGLSGGTVTAATTQYVEATLGNDSAAAWLGWTGFTGTMTNGIAPSFIITSSTNHSGVVVAVALRETTSAPTLTPTGIPSGEVLGSPSATLTLTSTPTAINTAEALGAPTATITPPAQTLSPTAVGSAEAMGTPVASTTLTSTPTGVASAAAVGTPSISGALTLSPTGISTAAAAGQPSATTTLTSSPAGIASAVALGTPSAAVPITGAPLGIASALALGAPAATATLTASPVGIASGEAMGVPSATMPGAGLTASPTGIPTGVAMGTPRADLPVEANLTGIPSALEMGVPAATSTIQAEPGGIASQSALGTPQALWDIVAIAESILSAEAMGTPSALSGPLGSPAQDPRVRVESGGSTVVVDRHAVTAQPYAGFVRVVNTDGTVMMED